LPNFSYIFLLVSKSSKELIQRYLLIAIITIKSRVVQHVERITSAWPGETVMTSPGCHPCINYECQGYEGVEPCQGWEDADRVVEKRFYWVH